MKVDEHLIQQLAERLRQAVRHARHIDVAQIQIIGLDDVKRRAGPLWADLASRVRETSTEFINHRIAEHDVVIPAGDGFLVIYAEVQGAAEKSKALQAALDIFYLGDEATSGLSALVQHSAIAPETLMGRLAEPTLRPAFETAHALPLPDVAVMPVWSVAQQAITGYWIAPHHPDRLMARYGYDREWIESGIRRQDIDTLATDLMLLDRAVADALTCVQRDRRCLIGYSVHATTMLNKTRRQHFLHALAATPLEVRPLLLGRVAEVEAGTPIATMADWVHQLRPVSPRVAIELHHTQRDLSGMKDVGVFSVACVLPSVRPSAAEAAAQVRTIEVWSRDLKRQGLKLRLDNVVDPRLLACALDKGADFCSGEGLWPAVPAPEGMKPYSRDQFLRALPAAAPQQRSA